MRLDSIKQAYLGVDQSSSGRKWASTILKTAVSLGLVMFLFSRVDISLVGKSFRTLHVGVFLMAVAGFILLQLVYVLRWQVMVRVLDYEQRFRRLLAFYFMGFFFNLFLPTSIGGDVGRCYYLADSRRDMPKAFTTILADRGTGMLALMSVGSVALLMGPEIHIPDWMAWVTLGGTILLLGSVVIPFFFPSIFWRFHWPRLYWKNPPSLFAAIGLSFVIQLSIVGINILIGAAIGAEIPLLYYFIFVPLVTIAGMIPISLNGLGVREGAYVFFLTQAGMSDADALVFALAWLIVVLVISGIGGIVWVMTSRKQISAKA